MRALSGLSSAIGPVVGQHSCQRTVVEGARSECDYMKIRGVSGHTEEVGQSPISKTLNQIEQLADGRVRFPTLAIFEMRFAEPVAITNRASIEKVRCVLFPVI